MKVLLFDGENCSGGDCGSKSGDSCNSQNGGGEDDKNNSSNEENSDHNGNGSD